MFAVAKKSKPVASSATRQIPSPKVVATTSEWRERVRNELDARGRGARADLTRHIKERHPSFSSGQLTELLADDEKPGQKRFSQYVGEIEAYLWPSMMPLSQDTEEVRYLLDGLRQLDKDLLRMLLDMGPEGQQALKVLMLANKPK